MRMAAFFEFLVRRGSGLPLILELTGPSGLANYGVISSQITPNTQLSYRRTADSCASSGIPGRIKGPDAFKDGAPACQVSFRLDLGSASCIRSIRE